MFSIHQFVDKHESESSSFNYPIASYKPYIDTQSLELQGAKFFWGGYFGLRQYPFFVFYCILWSRFSNFTTTPALLCASMWNKLTTEINISLNFLFQLLSWLEREKRTPPPALSSSQSWFTWLDKSWDTCLRNSENWYFTITLL